MFWAILAIPILPLLVFLASVLEEWEEERRKAKEKEEFQRKRKEFQEKHSKKH